MHNYPLQHTKDFVFWVHKMVIGDINTQQGLQSVNSKIDRKGTVNVQMILYAKMPDTRETFFAENLPGP